MGLPGAWTVLLLRAVVVHPAGCGFPSPCCEEPAVAFERFDTLGTRDQPEFHEVIAASLLSDQPCLVAPNHLSALTEGDCVAIRERMQSAWEADANEAATLGETAEFRRFIKDESARIGARWMTEYRKLVGSDIDRAEVACLRKAARIDDVARCAPQ